MSNTGQRRLRLIQGRSQCNALEGAFALTLSEEIEAAGRDASLDEQPRQRFVCRTVFIRQKAMAQKHERFRWGIGCNQDGGDAMT